MTVEGGALRKDTGGETLTRLLAGPLPEPPRDDLGRPWNVLVTGVGGTGVVTIGAILAMAAHLEGKGCSTLDMKGGPVTTHLRLAAHPDALNAVRIAASHAVVMLACDPGTAAGKDALTVLARGRTKVVLNGTTAITPGFVRDRDFSLPSGALRSVIEGVVGADAVETIAAGEIATRLLGDTIATNLFMVGYAYQKGLNPLTETAILKAVALNGAAVGMNTSAFRLGRRAAHEPDALGPANDDAPGLEHLRASASIDEIITRRVTFLTHYQDAAYAEQYSEAVAEVRAREMAVSGSAGPLTEAVARNLFKLMAYKDEYEVARLYTGAAFAARLDAMFESRPRLTFHLAPPPAPRAPEPDDRSSQEDCVRTQDAAGVRPAGADEADPWHAPQHLRPYRRAADSAR